MVSEYILKLDSQLFIFINRDLSNSFFDWLMPLVSYAGNSGLLWLSMAILLAVSNRNFSLRGLVLVVLALVSSFLLADIYLKEVVARPRPFVEITGVNLLIPAPQDYSFPSGHAATAFASAMVIVSFIPRLFPAVALMAVTAAFSRVYVGVHYPLDVLGGALLGVITGWFFWKLAGFTTLRRDSRSPFRRRL